MLPSAAQDLSSLEKIQNKLSSRRRKPRSLLQTCKRTALKHTWSGPLAALLFSFSLYAIYPYHSNPLRKFIFLSYPIPASEDAPDAPTKYGKGLWDVAFVSFYMVFLSFTREFLMQRLLRPLAIYNGFHTKRTQLRFMEQMYTAIYFGFTGPWGLYVMSRTPVWYFNVHGMFEGFPHHTLEGTYKAFYLFQVAYWGQQAVVMLLGLEARRKDFKELVMHHVCTITPAAQRHSTNVPQIVTVALAGGSYRYHFTHMGIGVFITHDISDFFFATSKVLNYMEHPLVAPYFALFIASWIYLRHYLNLIILRSEWYEFKTVGPYGPLDYENGQFKGPVLHFLSASLLVTLQALNLFWLYHILRIAIRFATTGNSTDDRSDTEEDAEVTISDELESLDDAEGKANLDDAESKEAVRVPRRGTLVNEKLMNGGKGIGWIIETS